MNTYQNDRKTYVSPELTRVQFDNQISLQLDSYAPEGPGEAIVTDFLTQDEAFSLTIL